jgi:hypothetical protein
MNDLAVATALATSPVSAFTELRERPRFWFPLIVVVLATAVVVGFYYSVVDIEWLKDALYSNNADFQKLPEAQRAQAMAFVGRKTMLISGIVGTCMGLPFFYLVNSLYLLLAAKVTKVQYGLKHWFTLTSWSALPALLSAVIAILLLLIRDNDQVGPGILQPLGLNELVFHRPMGDKVQPWLDALNIPGILGWVLAIIGVRTWTQRSWLFSAVYVLIPVVLLFGIWGIFAFR